MSGDRFFGPVIGDGVTTFRLWAPSLQKVELLLGPSGRVTPMNRAGDGFWSADVEDAGPGTRYKFRSGELEFPDLASRQQEGDATGWSVVRQQFESPGARTARPWHEALVCEVHIGTVSPEGTFEGLRRRLGHFRDAGYTCLELMPINQFPGQRNWGYDGTLIFAPAAAYGTPEELRTLVDHAHELQIALILDVVYNHFGETANYARQYLPEWFADDIETPWGPGIDFSNPVIRQFYYENARMWLSDYGFDGLRFDSVHEIRGEGRDQFLSELASTCRAVDPLCLLTVENMNNNASWLERDPATNVPKNFTAQWNDDMHHVLTFLIAEEAKKTGYDKPDADPIGDLGTALADGFVHDGDGESSPAHRLPPDSFITYIENHDQIGNRADGTRLSSRVHPDRLDFANFVKFIAPQVPLCFMGDEGNLTSPFPFFVDLPEDAAARTRETRYKQMRENFNEDVKDGDLPYPNDPATFESAKLPWSDFEQERHRDALERFRTLASFRRQYVWPLAATPCIDARVARQGNCLIVNWEFEAGTLSIALNPSQSPMDINCRIMGVPVSTGRFDCCGDVLRLGAWSAVAWSSRRVQ